MEIFNEACVHPRPAELISRVDFIIGSATDREQDALDAYQNARTAFVECLGIRKIKENRWRTAVLARINQIRSIESRREIFRTLD